MLAQIKQFFSEQLAPAEQQDPQQAIQLAAAVLMIELSRADFQQQPEELAAIEAALYNKFQLDSQQREQLLRLADQQARDATALHPFTRLINEHYSAPQKYELVKQLWHIALADGDISKYEDHLVRKIAELIYLPHSEFIRAKLAVQNSGDST